ncbi:MAG: hypothetical protein AB7I01_13760 [Gammaproteobacteria bacterium]
MTATGPAFGQADLTTCDGEPIHSPGSTQPHGVLLVVDREDFAIRQFAGDTRFMLGIELARLALVSLFAPFDQNPMLPIARRLHVPQLLIPCPRVSDQLALDMSYCSLRSVSPIHIEYLGNLGVTASMSLSLVIGGELWRPIACHNDSPRYLSADLRVVCELYAQICSLQFEAHLETDAARRRMVPRTVQGSCRPVWRSRATVARRRAGQHPPHRWPWYSAWCCTN